MGVTESVKNVFTLDTRSIAVFRMGLGLLIIIDALLRTRNFHYFYTDPGIGTHIVEAPPLFSFFTSDPVLNGFLFILYFLVGLQLLIGYKSRLAVLLGTILVFSITYHNTAVISYADFLMRALMFAGLFLPLGEKWSIDAVLMSREQRRTVFNIGTVLAPLQMVVMYFVNGISKLGVSDYWLSGDAANFILRRDHLTWLFIDIIRELPNVLIGVGGTIWFILLLISPLLLILTGWKRTIFAIFYAGGHISFILTTRIGAFPYVALVGLTVFITPPVWDYLSNKYEKDEFTDVREYCIEQASALPELYSIDVKHYTELFREKVPNWGIILFIGLLFLAVQQPWTIFAPDMNNEDRYTVVVAETEDGDVIDLRDGGDVSFDRPYEGSDLHKQYDTYRHRFFYRTVAENIRDTQREYVVHECSEFENDSEIVSINFWDISEEITSIEEAENIEERHVEATLTGKYSFDGSEPGVIVEPDVEDSRIDEVTIDADEYIILEC